MVVMNAHRSPTLVARTPEDLLAMVPVVLGFRPQESLVMLTFDAARPFHARVDLPEVDEDVGRVVDLLVDPVNRHGVGAVVLVVYGADSPVRRRLARTLAGELAAHGVTVVDVLRVEGDRRHRLVGDRWGAGVRHDVSAHPFLAEAVWHGLVTHESRAALAGSIAADPAAVRRVRARLPDRPLALGTPVATAEVEWAVVTVAAAVADGGCVGDGAAARLLLALADETARNGVWSLMSRATARDHVRFWTDLVRRAPDGVLAAPAALLAFAAWLAGDGALAWCALDRCVGDDPDYPLAAQLGLALNRAVPPSAWDGPGSRADAGPGAD